MSGSIFKSFKAQPLPQINIDDLVKKTGGAPLLQNIAMGASVEDTLAGYYGAGSYDELMSKLSPAAKEYVSGLRTQLSQIQGHTDSTRKDVNDIVGSYGKDVALDNPGVLQAKQAAGNEFDAATRASTDLALRSVAAKYGTTGSLSSGAAIQAQADAAAKIGMNKLHYMSDAGDTTLAFRPN